MSDTHSHSAAFVRTETLPQLPPPVTERGAIKWMREKLFATIPNAILTLVSLYVVFSVLSGVLPWIFNGVWNASSLAECREILDGTRGACFAVLTERWPQLLFGLAYPSTEYWRPGLAFVMLFVAAAPVLFFDLPRKLLIFTALYPFIAFWLIWGGTILTPILALVGFVAGYLVYQKYVASSFALGFLGGVLAAIIVWWLGGMLIPENASDNAMLVSVASRNLGGFMLNMMLGVTCVSLSVPLGAGSPVINAVNQMDLCRLHRVHSRCTVDYTVVRSLGHARVLLPARKLGRLVLAGCHHDYDVLGGLYRRGDPWWPGRFAKGTIRGGQQPWA